MPSMTLRRSLCSSAIASRVGRRVVRGRKIFADGTAEDVQMSARELLTANHILPRDLRLMVTRTANLSARPEYFLCRFPPLTSIVTCDWALLVDDSGGEDISSVGCSRGLMELANGVVATEIKRSLERDQGDDASVPFEHRVLDTILREDLVRKQEHFAMLSQQIALALSVCAQLALFRPPPCPHRPPPPPSPCSARCRRCCASAWCIDVVRAAGARPLCAG